MNAQASFAICLVEDAFAHAGSYVIRMPAGPLVPATDLSHAACLPLGSRPITVYPPKSRVLVMFMPTLEHAIILGAVTRQLSDARLILPDSLVMRSRVGICEDPMHHSVFNDPKSSLGNHSAGRPADCLPGDWGYVNDLGLAVFLGKLMASIRASDLAKVEAFWGDDLLRLVGYNMQVYTAGAEEYRVNDEGEYNEVYRASPFPWEALGKGGGPANAAAVRGGKLEPGQEDANHEPQEDDQQIIARHVRFRGYLGDIEREIIAVPPIGLSTERFSESTKYNGVLEIIKNSGGAYAVRSAKEITFEKYCLIPVPKEKKSPDDPTGANSKNYKAAGQLGSGEDHELPEFVWGDETDPGIRAAQLPDYHAWFFNRYSMPGLRAHAKLGDDGDWYTPDEGELTDISTTVLYDKSLNLGHKFRAELPSYGELVVDARGGHSTRYYRSRSLIKQLDDGSVLFEGGYGEQILLSGGNIELTCPGDVWLRPGRNAVIWSPHDAIIRAGNSVDITASKKDVRIKADANLHMLAGNSGVGGMLFECRAEGPAMASDYDEIGEQVRGHGIAFKAEKSSFHVFAKDLYIGRTQDSAGDLVIDGGDTGTLYLRGRDLFARTLGMLAMVHASESLPDKQMFALNASAVVVSTPMQIGGTVEIAPVESGGTADLIVSGNVLAYRGVAAGSGAPFIAPLDSNVKKLIAPENLGKLIRDQVDTLGELLDVKEELIAEDEDTSPANSDFQSRIGFSCRDTETDLKLEADSFVIYEARWQQMLRTKGTAKEWDEPEVEAPTGDITRPHPGQAAWEDWDAYGEVDNDVNFQSGNAAKAKNREEMSEDGNKPRKRNLKSSYLITVQD